MQHLTSFHIDLAGRRRLAIGNITPTTSLADVIERLSDPPPRRAAVLVDGRITATSQPLAGSGVRHGSRIDLDIASGGARPIGRPAGSSGIEAVWVCGPDAGAAVTLGHGRHIVGRSATARIRCDDDALEPHHAVIEVDGSGASFQQLCGRAAAVIDGTTVSGRVGLVVGQRIELGASVLTLRLGSTSPIETAPQSPTRAGDPWRRPFVRSPRPIVVASPSAIEVPRESAAPGGLGGGLLPTLLGVAGAAALALVFHQLMFLLFGLMGAVVAIGTWIAQRVGAMRSRTGVAAANRMTVATFVEALANQRAAVLGALLANTPTLDAAVAAMASRSAALWAVRPCHDDALRVCVGYGEGFWQPPVAGLGNASAEALAAIDAASRLGVVPVSVELCDGAVVAVVGDEGAAAVARSMVLQLASRCGPADWRLAIVTDRPEVWDGLGWLGHIADAAGAPRLFASIDADRLVAALDDGDDRHIVVIVDGPAVLHARTDALRRLLAGRTPTAFVVVCGSEAEIPAAATSALLVGRGGTARWIVDTRVSALAESVRFAGIGAAHAAACAASIADLLDPEHIDDTSSIPAATRLLELLGGRDTDGLTEAIAARWAAAGDDPPLRCPLGVAADGVVEIDLVRDGPHALLAGTTGAGKSELLRTIVLGLAARASPEHVSFVLVDYKGGATFDACAALPHVVGVVTDLDERLAARALRSLEAELRRREHVLRCAGASDLAAYRSSPGPGRAAMPRLVVIVDEFATLAAQVPDFMGALLGIAQRGRSLGVHLLLATQRPTGVVNDNIRANTNLRIALRVQDAADAMDVVGDPTAAGLPRSIPGRAVMRLGAEERIVFQTATCSIAHRGTAVSGDVEVGDVVMGEMHGRAARPTAPAADPGIDVSITDMGVIVAAITAACRRTDAPAPHRPWAEPLPAVATVEDVVALVGSAELPTDEASRFIGIVDDPDGQCRAALTWPVGAGHLVLAGATGSGTTTALLAVAGAVGRTTESGTRPAAEIYIIDALGDARLADLEDAPGVVAVVRLHERERLGRVLDQLARRITSVAPSAPADVVLLVDGFGALRADLEAAEQWARLEQLDAIIDGGLAAGVRVAMTVTRCGALPSRMLSGIAGRWVFHLADPLDATVLGVPARFAVDDIPGRMIDAASGREAQILVPTARPAISPTSGLDRRVVAPVIAELPPTIEVGVLPEPVVVGGDVLAPVGIGFESMRPAELSIASGEHVLVIGPSRTGRTSALHTIADRWRIAHPTGWIASIAPRRTSARVGFVGADVAELIAAMPVDRPVLVVVDDAELVDDPGGVLAARISARADGFTVIAAGRPDSLRSSFGHFTAAIRRCRIGVIMTGASDLDADLLGAVLPRRLPIPARPGLAWIIADGERELVQLAMTTQRPSDADCSLDVAGAVP